MIHEKISIELGHVQRTLLLPLWGRAVETQKINPLLIDNTALEVFKKVDFDFSTFANKINPVTQYAWIARSLHFDRTIKRFLLNHPKGTVVNIGCGLDTTFERVDNGTLYWYDLDLPDVINLRRDFIPENNRRKFLECSFLDDEWLKQLKIEDNVLFIAAGVFYYFEELQLKNFFIKLAGIFPGSEIFFDAASELGLRMSNKKVIRDGGMDEKSFLKWGIDNAKEIQYWDNRIELIDKYPIFKKMKSRLDLGLKIGTFISDILNIMYMVHLRIRE